MIQSKRIRAYLRSSLWFLPTLIIIGGMGLAVGLIYMDAQVKTDWQERWPHIFGVSAEGARAMLATIAGSMITVAGVVFSITVLAMAQASTQYSPRILRNFMRDRANQAVLGMFAAIFAYCLVVLRTIRTEQPTFVPSIAVLASFGLALLGIGLLISFIHHVATSLQATHIIAAAAMETLAAIDVVFPQQLGDEDCDDGPDPGFDAVLHERKWYAIPAASSGYIQSVENEALIEYAVEHESILCMERGIGDFVIAGAPLIWTARSLVPNDGAEAAVNKLFAINQHRTIEQDAPFGMRQLVDIALKALSPSVNDTTTAVTCVDYLTAIMAKLASRRFPSRLRYHQNELRVIAVSPTFDQLWSLAFHQIRRNSRDNVALLWRQLRAFQIIGQCTQNPSRREVLRRQLAPYEELVHRIGPDCDRKSLQVAYENASAVLANGESDQKPAPSAIGDAA